MDSQDLPGRAADPLKEQKGVGARKPCPVQGGGRWDEGYRARADLPAGTPVLHVDPAAAPGGDGSKGRPFNDPRTAVDKAPAGAVVLLAPGSYAWGLTVRKSLHLVGTCTSGVRLSPRIGSTGPGLQLLAAPVTVEGLTLSGAGMAQGYGVSAVNLQGGQITIRQVRIDEAYEAGVLVLRSPSVTIEDCTVTRTVRKSFGRGINIERLTGRATIRRTVVSSCPSIGVMVNLSRDVELVGNLIQSNGTKDPLGRGVVLQDNNGGVVLRANRVVESGAEGVVIAAPSGAEVKGNLLQGNCRLAPTRGALMVIEAKGGVAIGGNTILDNQCAGIVVQHGRDVRLVGNLVSRNRSTAHDRGAVMVADQSGELLLEANRVNNNKIAGVVVSLVGGVSVRGNRIEGNGIDGDWGWGWGVSIYGASGKTVVAGNRFNDNRQNGLALLTVAGAELVGNIFSGNATKEVGAGLSVQVPGGPLGIRTNLLEGNGIGCLLSALEDTREASFTGNVWANNRLAGLDLRSCRGAVKLRRGLFTGNAGAHVRVLNSRSLEIEGAGMAMASASPGDPTIALPRSKGTGILASASGVVRWVFAKAEYPCSLTKTGRVKPPAPGWTMRPIRVPWALDPCYHWGTDPRYRTDDSRVKGSACYRKCGPSQGCRWIWVDDGVGDSLGKGRWRPSSEALRCVPKGQPDSCDGVPAPAGVRPIPVTGRMVRYGQCRKLPSGTPDPCHSATMKTCREREISRTGYCVRVKVEDGGKKTTAGCASWRGPERDLLCRPDVVAKHPCPSGTVCFGELYDPLLLNVLPSAVVVRNSVFWANGGPDLLLDMAGRTSLKDNLYLSCVPGPGAPDCRSKMAYRLTVSQPGQPAEWRKAELPGGAAIVWQNPSPYPQAQYESRLDGSDLFLTWAGKSLLYRPSLCQAVTTH